MRTRPIDLKFTAIIISIIWICLSLLLCDSKNGQESEAARFDRLARDAFQEVYPSLAEQILDDYHIRTGSCLDIGCGPGYLDIELAKRSQLKIIGVDIDPEAVKMATKNVRREKLTDRITIEIGDVHQLRFADDTCDLIVSRGSFLFWENTFQAFREIYRVLKPGGVAFIGGGMGRAITPEKKAVIKRKIEQAGFLKSCQRMITPVMMQEILISINIPAAEYKILPDGPGDSGCRCGMWVEVRKSDPNVSISRSR